MTEKEIEAAIADIAEIRENIQGKLKIMRPLFLDRAFAPFSLGFGILIAALIAALHYISAAYGGFDAMPASAKFALLGALVALLAISGFLKQRIISKALGKQDRSLTVFSLFRLREFREFYLLSVYGFLLLAAGTGIACMSENARWWVFLPLCSLYVAFVFALMSLVFRLPEFRLLSLLAAAFGLAAVAFMKGDYLLWIAAFTALMPGAYSLMVITARSNRIERS